MKERRDLDLVETTYRLPGAPSIALLADLHNRPYSLVVSSLQRHKPSVICVAGDVVYGTRPKDDVSPLESQENVLPFLRDCASIAPSFLSLGNHEWALDDVDLHTIRETGVTVLDNEWQRIKINGKELIIGGLTSVAVLDYRSYKKTGTERYPEVVSPVKKSQPDISWLSDFCSVSGYKIILSHHPEYWPRISSQSLDLCLSAHCHGGQWRFLGRGVFAPGQGWWPKYSKGVYESRLVISAGLSNTAQIPRLFNPTEVVYIEAK